MHTVVSRPVVAAARRVVARELSSKAVTNSLLLSPALLGQPQRPRQRQQQLQSTPGERQEPPCQLVQRKKRGLRRLRVLCASAVGSLPATGLAKALGAAVLHLGSIASASSISGLAAGGLALAAANKGIRRWHAARRSAKRAMATVSMGAVGEVSIVTFNVRGVMDRWPERAPLLRQCLKQADADVFCFQEVLTGEFAQELALLPQDYQVHECRAALSHLRSSSVAGALYASAVAALLNISWTRGLLVSLPESIEVWRERHQLTGDWSRLLRDLAIAPFFGNSIASRLPTVTPPQQQQQQRGSDNKQDGSTINSSNKQGQPDSSSIGGIGSSIRSCLSSMTLGSPFFGGGSSSSSSSNSSSDLLILGGFRAAQRVCLQLKLSVPLPQQQQPAAGRPRNQAAAAGASGAAASNAGDAGSGEVAYVWLVNTHLDHAAPEIRSRQMQAICEWVEPLKPCCAGIIITGDLNAPPSEALHELMLQHGFLSAHKVVHGSEPPHTWPSGIQAPLMDVGEPHCADYIYAWQAPGYQLQVAAAQVCGATPCAADETLYPSDHLGLLVRLRVAALQSTGSDHSNVSGSKKGSGSKQEGAAKP